MSAGYEFVRLPDRIEVRVREEAVHDRRVKGTLSGCIVVTFVAEQPVHIGSGYKGLVDGKVVRCGTLVRGVPGLPGSSLKGVLRARYEAITRSCAPGGTKEFWKVRSQSMGLDGAPARLTQEARNKSVFRAHEYPKEQALCPACALWGRMSFRSRVSVADFASDGVERFDVAKMPKQFGPNVHHVGPFRRTGDGGRGERAPVLEVFDLHGRKFAVGRGPSATDAKEELVEVIPRGTELRGEIRIANVVPAELGGLLIALGWGRYRSVLKIGGGKALGFGRVRASSVTYRLKDYAGRAISADEAAWSDHFERSEDRFLEGSKRLVEIHQGDC